MITQIKEYLSSLDNNEITTLILSIIGALAWIPSLIQLSIQLIGYIKKHKRKIKMNVVDIKDIGKATVGDAYKTREKDGTILLLAANVFVPKESYYSEDIEVTAFIETTGKTQLRKGILIDGEIIIHSEKESKLLNIPEENNFNLHREIICESDNVRAFAFMFEDSVFSIRSIQKLEILFKGKPNKKVVLHSYDFPVFNHMGYFAKHMEHIKSTNKIYK